MSPAALIAAQYEKNGLNFDHYERLHRDCGFVFATPLFFAMGRPVPRAALDHHVRDPERLWPKEECDAWWIHALAGDMSKAWSIMPWELPWIGFERFDSELHWYPVSSLRRLCPPSR